MCGIMGYVGVKPAEQIVFEGLARMEYRGYDNAGMASLDADGRIDLRRVEGKPERLAELLRQAPLSGRIAIGHTRWATHGTASVRNAHPHVAGKVAVVHNGVIENFLELREELERQGCRFQSQTDTEVIAHLVNVAISSGADPLCATRAAIGRLRGSFAMVLMFEGNDDLLVAARKSSPLALGFADHGSFIGSCERALGPVADRVLHLEEGDVAIVTRRGATVYGGDGIRRERTTMPNVHRDFLFGKEGHPHFMLKEIFEQPKAVRKTLEHCLSDGGVAADFWDGLTRLSLVACGTAYHAGLVARHWFEQFAGLITEVDFASEFRYREMFFAPDHGGIFISQSGETADTLAALQRMKIEGCPTLALVNAEGSALARAAHATMIVSAGPEIAVASTKAFTAQLVALACLALQVGEMRTRVDAERRAEFLVSLRRLPELIGEALATRDVLAYVAKKIADARAVFFVGRGTSYAIALEGALKLKEVSYLHAEGFAAGELKHGSLALIEEGVPVIVIAPQDRWFDKTASNLQEIAARGGKIVLISDRGGCEALKYHVAFSVALPKADQFAAPVLSAVAVQLLAYYVAVCRGTDIDRPRNLAKSVTVE